MKKIARNLGMTSLFLTLATTAVSPAEAGRYYAGLGAGAAMGQTLVRGVNTTILNNGAKDYNSQPRFYVKKTSFIGGGFVGYTHDFSSLLVGVEGGINWTPGKASKRYSFIDNPVANQTHSYALFLSRDYTLHLTTKAGINLSDEFSAALLVGAAYSQFKLQLDGTIDDGVDHTDDSSSKKKKLWAFAPGVELTYNIDQNWGVGLTYVCEIYQSVAPNLAGVNAAAPNILNTVDTTSEKIHPTFHTIMARVTYRF